MNKVHITLTGDDEIIKKAKDRGVNLSHIFDKAIRDRLQIEEVYIPEIPNHMKIEKCFFCEKEDYRACRENNYKGMVILAPDEKWICPLCLKIKQNSVISGARS